MNDEYCPKHKVWFGPMPCPQCVQERDAHRATLNRAYENYTANDGLASFELWAEFERAQLYSIVAPTADQWELLHALDMHFGY